MVKPTYSIATLLDYQKIGYLMSEEFIQTLDQCWPPRPPNPNDSEREIWMKAGERRLVEILQAKFNEANERIL